MRTAPIEPSPGFALRGLATVLLLCGAACREAPPVVLEPVVRLTEVSAPPRTTNAPPACAVGGEIRPSFGCPPFILLVTKMERIAPDRIRLTVDTPPYLAGQDVVVLPSVRLGPGGPLEALPLSSRTNLGPTISLEAPYDTSRLADKSRAQIQAHVLEPLVREFETRPTEIPEQAVLEVGLGVADFAEAAGAGGTRFRLEARWESGEQLLLEESLPASAGGRWRDRRVDLADLAHRKVIFRFVTTTDATPDLPRSTAAYPVWGAPEVLAPRLRDGRLNLVLVSLDTVRADFLGGTVDGVRLTPWFDRLAREGATFSQVVSTFSSTSASHMSLFTGVYPATHGVRYATHRLPDAIQTLPEVLAHAGYSTGAVTENAMILAGSGFARGFDAYRENRDTMKHAGSVDQTFGEGIGWLERHRDRLFFLFLHTYEAHSPYTPTEEALRAVPEVDTSGLSPADVGWRRTRRRYAAEVRYTDQALEHLFSELARLDVLDDTLVAVTADHGEELGEHGLLGHAKTVYDEVLRVPLLLWAPTKVPAGRVVDEQISLVDVAPTLLDLLGLRPPAKIPGRSVAGALHGDPISDGGVRFAEALYGKVRMVAARTRDHKWIWRDDGSELRVYDLQSDPGETAPLDDPALRDEGRALIEAYLTLDQPRQPAPARELDEATRRKLEALGYTQ